MARSVFSSKACPSEWLNLTASVPNPTFLIHDLLSSFRGDFLNGHDPEAVCPQKTTNLVGPLSFRIPQNSNSSCYPFLFHVCQNLHGHFQEYSGSFNATLTKTSVERNLLSTHSNIICPSKSDISRKRPKLSSDFVLLL